MAYIGNKGVKYSDDKTILLICPILFEGQRLEGEFVIPQGVKTIAKGAFRGTKFSSVIFPESLEDIEDGAFKRCEKLKKIVFPNQLKRIGNEAFSDCKHVEEVVFSDSIEYIGQSAFRSCGDPFRPWKNNAQIPAGIKEIGEDAFAFSGISKVTFPDDSKNSIIDEGVFMGTDLHTIIIPTAITKIGMDAFKWCRELESIKIRNSNILIGNSAFEGCEKLSKIIVPKGKKKWIIMHNRHLHHYYPVVGVGRSIEEIIEEAEN